MDDNLSTLLTSLVLPKPEDYDKIFNSTQKISSIASRINNTYLSNQAAFSFAKSDLNELASQIKESQLKSNPFENIQKDLVEKLKQFQTPTVVPQINFDDFQQKLSIVANAISSLKINETLQTIDLQTISSNFDYNRFYEDNKRTTDAIFSDLASEKFDELIESGEITDKTLSIVNNHLPKGKMTSEMVYFIMGIVINFLVFFLSIAHSEYLSNSSTKEIKNKINISHDKTDKLIENNANELKKKLKHQNSEINSIKNNQDKFFNEQGEVSEKMDEINEKLEDVYFKIQQLIIEKSKTENTEN